MAYITNSTILIVDDTLVNLQILKKVLVMEGYGVRAASHGQEALLSAQTEPPDLILLDIMMPEMNGYEVCRRLKTHPTTQDIPVIFISALYETVDKVKAFDVGGVDFITKPFQIKEVSARVKIQLELRQARKLLAEQNKQLAQEITERKQAEAALAKRNHYQTTLVELQKHLLQAHPRPQMYQFIASLLGQATQVSRVHIYDHETNAQGEVIATLQAEWYAEHITPLREQIPSFSYNEIAPHWLKTLHQGEPLIVTIDNALPIEHAFLQATGVISFLAFPLIIRNKLLGLVSFNECHQPRAWQAADLDWLWVGITSITFYLEQQLAEKALQETNNDLAKRVAELAIMNHIAELITKLTDIETIFQVALSELSHFVQAAEICGTLLNPPKTELEIITIYSSIQSEEQVAANKKLTLPLAVHCIERQAVETKKSQLVSRDDMERFAKRSYLKRVHQGIHWFLVVPLLTHDEVIGTINLKITQSNRQFLTTEINFIETVASQIAGAIEVARSIQETTKAKEIVESAYQTLQKANSVLSHLATMDGLTQIANRRRFDEYLAQTWQKSGQMHTPITLILCDVDHFKRYNDHYGHQMGDTCLQKIAHALQLAAIHPQDLVARYGGEEFVIVLPQTDTLGAMTVAQAVQNQVARLQIPHEASATHRYVTVSIGVATMTPNDNNNLETLLAHADQALYQAKKQGRNQIALAED